MAEPSSTSRWRGHYFDGRTPASHPAIVILSATQLQIALDGGATLTWPYAQIRQAQGAYEGEQVRLERGGEYPETLVVESSAFLDGLHRVAPELTRRFQAPERRAIRWAIGLLTAAIVLALSFAIYFRALPAIAVAVASRVPASWEARLGERTIAHLAPPERRCSDPIVAQAIDAIVTALSATRPSPYTFRVVVVDNRAVNAFAAPGGYLVVNRGLLEVTRSPEELAGVLAHEIQHVLQRHATRAMVQQASTGFLIAAVIGDPGSAVAYGLEAAQLLGTLRYSRIQEEEADVEGLKMIRDAKIDPQGMIGFFETMKARGDVPDILKYLSTHPATQARIDRLRALTGDAPTPTVKLLADSDWKDTKRRCAQRRRI